MSNIITFDDRCKLQARFLTMKTKQTGEDEVTVVSMYAERLAEKIDKKYITLYPKQLKRMK